MTENEAVKRIEDYIKECNYTWTVDAIFAEYVKLQNHCYISYTARDVIDNCVTPLKVLQAKALEEIQMYRDGKLSLVPRDVFKRQCEELDAYKELGTVEEVEKAAEKTKTKKCVQDTCHDHTHYKCPTCGKIQMSVYTHGFPRLGRIPNNCDNCGQELEGEE